MAVKRDSRGRFLKGSTPISGFEKGHPKYTDKGEFKKGAKHPRWNKESSRDAGHYWINLNYNKRGYCEICLKSKKELSNRGKRLEWANKDHKYKRNKKEWFTLCSACHRRLDTWLKKYKVMEIIYGIKI